MKIGLCYIHCNEIEYLVPSLKIQSPFVDAVAILDSTPPQFGDHQAMMDSALAACGATKCSFVHSLEHGAGFDDEFRLGFFDEVKARNHAIKLMFEMDVDYMIQCDADEWYSPGFFEFVRANPTSAISLPELKWYTREVYLKSAYHLRGCPRESNPRFLYNDHWTKQCEEAEAKTGKKYNKSLHCPLIIDGPSLSIEDLWHNHVHDCMGPKRGQSETPAGATKYSFNENMLMRGKWPEAYDPLYKKSYKPQIRNSGWEAIHNEKDAAFFIIGEKNYDGYLTPDHDLMNIIPRAKKLRILDMCCGIGRNTIWIKENWPDCQVFGYDLPNMIRMAHDYTKRHLDDDHGIVYTDDFDDIAKLEFDVVFCQISFQHILPQYLDVYYPALANCLRNGGMIWVHGRDWSDHNNNEIVWDRLGKCFLLDEAHPLSKKFYATPFLKDFCPNGKDHHGGVFRPRKPESFSLLTGYYTDASEIRTNELRTALKNNVENPLINSIHLFVEDGSQDYPDDPKIVVNKTGHRMTFEEMFEYANRNLSGIVVMASADIYLDQSLRQIRKENLTDAIFCLSRWESDEHGNLSPTESPWSQDTYIFKVPMRKLKADWTLGRPGCDNRLVFEARKAGIRPFNPSKSIRSIHLHESKIRRYTAIDAVEGPYNTLSPIYMDDVRKDAPIPRKEALQYFASCIETNTPFSFAKFGDGEFLCMIKTEGVNGNDGHPYSPELAKKLRDALQFLSAKENSFIAYWIYDMIKERDQLFAELKIKPNFADYDTILQQERKLDDDLLAFYRAIKTSGRKKIFVGPKILAGVQAFLQCAKHIEVPLLNSFSEFPRIKEELMSELTEDGIAIFSAGMPSKPLIHEILRQRPAVTCIDAGSGFDPIFVGNTRLLQPPAAEVQEFYRKAGML